MSWEFLASLDTSPTNMSLPPDPAIYRNICDKAWSSAFVHRVTCDDSLLLDNNRRGAAILAPYMTFIKCDSAFF
eukprot:813777-Amphidinium_carterae.1